MIIPVKPISVNECWQGRRYKTDKYDAFIADMLRMMPKQEMIKGNTKVMITLHIKSLVRGDIDNFCKPIIDCLVKKGWIDDDRYIQQFEIEKIKDKNEGIEVEITRLKN